MKATVRTERYYTIVGADGSQQDDWREVSRWNGMVELQRMGLKIIALPKDEFSASRFGEMFGDIFGLSEQKDFLVLKASPDVLEWLEGKR